MFDLGNLMSIGGPVLLSPIFLLVLAWSLLWKGWALWIAARKGEKWWFVAMLIINTVGILEIIYIFIVSKSGMTTVKNMQAKVNEKIEETMADNSAVDSEKKDEPIDSSESSESSGASQNPENKTN